MTCASLLLLYCNVQLSGVWMCRNAHYTNASHTIVDLPQQSHTHIAKLQKWYANGKLPKTGVLQRSYIPLGIECFFRLHTNIIVHVLSILGLLTRWYFFNMHRYESWDQTHKVIIVYNAMSKQITEIINSGSHKMHKLTNCFSTELVTVRQYHSRISKSIYFEMCEIST